MNSNDDKDICVHCFASSDRNNGDVEQEFQDIFDEIGVELRLDKLVEKYFAIKVENSSHRSRKLCGDCVNRMIEFFDLEEYNKKLHENEQPELNIFENHYENVILQRTLISEVDEFQSNSSDEESMNPVITTTSSDNQLKNEDGINDNITSSHVTSEDNTTRIDNSLENSFETQILLSDDMNIIEEVFHEVNVEETNVIPTIINIIGNNNVQNNNLVEETESIDDENRTETLTLISAKKDNTIKAMSDSIFTEEIPCSLEFDYVDLNAYLDLAVTTRFEDLDLEWSIVCKLCMVKFETFNGLLLHKCLTPEMCGDNYPCIFNECDELSSNVKLLARHMILRHYQPLKNLQIYGSCPECKFRFSNFTLYNKHSCCRHIRRKPGVLNYCTSCDLKFPSLKRYVFHMQFHYNKCRPKVCFICGAMFNKLDDFFEHVQYSHEAEGTLACNLCDRIFNDSSLFESHKRIHNTNDNYECGLCHQKYEQRHNLLSHMEIYHNYETKYLQCEYCGKQFVSNLSYRNHIKFHLPETEVYGYVCSECGLVTSDSSILEEHFEAEGETTCRNGIICEQILSVVYTCENCYCDYQSIEQLRRHRFSATGHNDQTYVCVLCTKIFDTFKRMRNHMKTHKSYEMWLENFPICRLYVCNVGNCEESYPLWTSLYYHRKRPHKNQNENNIQTEFKCQFCQKQCTTKMSLAVHVARAHNNKNVRCPHCNNSYKNDKLLQDHIYHMHVPIQCEKCLKIIKNRRNFETHMRIVHENVQRYFCTVCNRGFYHKSEMEQHQKINHEAVTLKCSICDFTTIYPKSLDIHVAKHNDVMGYHCKLCDKSYTRLHALNNHVRRQHSEKDCICCEVFENGCDAAFATYAELRKHAKKQHCKSNNHVERKARKRKQKKSHNTHNKSTKRKFDFVQIDENKSGEEEYEEILIDQTIMDDEVDNPIIDEEVLDDDLEKELELEFV